MLVKRSAKNQVAIPKALLERAGLGPEDVYFDMEYNEGRIILKPMQVEEKIPAEALARFKKRALKRGPGDRAYHSMEEAIGGLHKGLHRNERR